MSQPSLLDLPAVRTKVHRNVRATSKAQYAVAREQFTGRKADVLRWLAAYWNRYNVSPTSAELLAAQGYTEMNTDWIEKLLYARRGLSDLQTTGNVEAAGKRACRISGRLVETWRVTPR
jgi:sulfur relay (sulfurtransferase) DsrC/TusE family protein